MGTAEQVEQGLLEHCWLIGGNEIREEKECGVLCRSHRRGCHGVRSAHMEEFDGCQRSDIQVSTGGRVTSLLIMGQLRGVLYRLSRWIRKEGNKRSCLYATGKCAGVNLVEYTQIVYSRLCFLM